MHEAPTGNKKLLAVAGLIIIVAAIGAAVALGSTDKDTASTTPTPAVATSAGTPSVSPNASGAETPSSPYKDGTYAATGKYRSPGGNQEIQISVTLKDGKIADTSATKKASDPGSEEYQDKFIAGYKSLVVGKNIADVSLSKVSGSSLTGAGFNDAISQIKTEAKG